MSDAQDLLVEVVDGIAMLTLNRPERRNAINTHMVDAWADALRRFQDDDAVRVVVVTGAGSAFCAGGDVEAFGRDLDAVEQKQFLFDHVFQVAAALEVLDKPVIAAINGPAMGAGLDMALLCDIRIAAAGAVMGEAYIKVGVAPGDGGAWLLPRLIGVDRALDLLWTGRTVGAEEALAMGLVTKVVPDAELLDATRAYAAALASGPQQAIRITKRAVRQAATMDLRTHVDLMSSHMAILRTTRDFEEGVAALRERRPPKFD